jgi:hypothetical protein
MKIEFSTLDRMVCGLVGLSRNSSAAEHGMRLSPGRKDLGIETHVVGAMAEYAVARALNINWHPVTGTVDTYRGDVGKIQVKSIKDPRHKLIVQLHDLEEFKYVLCHVSMTEVTLLGWIEGVDAKIKRWLEEEDPLRGIHQSAYFVPQYNLRPIVELIPCEDKAA